MLVVSDKVAPIAKEPSFNDWGTAERASSVNDATNGIIIIPNTDPAIRALSELKLSISKNIPISRKKGPTVITAKNP